jgi:hypothetical protein
VVWLRVFNEMRSVVVSTQRVLYRFLGLVSTDVGCPARLTLGCIPTRFAERRGGADESLRPRFAGCSSLLLSAEILRRLRGRGTRCLSDDAWTVQSARPNARLFHRDRYPGARAGHCTCWSRLESLAARLERRNFRPDTPSEAQRVISNVS